MLKGGKLTVINFPGSTFTQALGINERDEIVGVYNDAMGTPHGFTDRDGHFVTVDGPAAVSTTLNGVNKDGRAVGFYMDGDGNTIGLVATAKQNS